MQPDTGCVPTVVIHRAAARFAIARRKELSMYSPKIDPQRIRKLYLLKMSYGSLGITKHMTEIVGEALDKHIKEAVKEIQDSGGTLLSPDELA